MKRRGMASIIAIVSIGLVTTTLATLSIFLAGEYRVTASTGLDAQLHQLLLAGAADASDHAKQWGSSPKADKWSIALPAELQQQEAQVSAESSSRNSSTFVELTAKLMTHAARQRLEYRLVDSHWQLVSAKLDE
jgi:hypothetical protein